jgi:anti-sigma factor RsiW
MKPEDDSRLVHAYLDGELDAAAAAEFEHYLAGNPRARAACEELRRLGARVREEADYHVAPESLRRRITREPAPGPRAARAWGSRWSIALAGFLAGAVTASVLFLLPPLGAREDGIRRDVVASHVRATLDQRLIDVASSDQHTVKPWLSSRLDFSPPVRDFAASGFELTGARLEYIGSRPVATLVYRHRLHVVDVFVWPAGGADRPLRTSEMQGFNIVHFVRDGMEHWVVSDVQAADLEAFAHALARNTP